MRLEFGFVKIPLTNLVYRYKIFSTYHVQLILFDMFHSVKYIIQSLLSKFCSVKYIRLVLFDKLCSGLIIFRPTSCFTVRYISYQLFLFNTHLNR